MIINSIYSSDRVFIECLKLKLISAYENCNISECSSVIIKGKLRYKVDLFFGDKSTIDDIKIDINADDGFSIINYN